MRLAFKALLLSGDDAALRSLLHLLSGRLLSYRVRDGHRAVGVSGRDAVRHLVVAETQTGEPRVRRERLRRLSRLERLLLALQQFFRRRFTGEAGRRIDEVRCAL